LNIIVFSFLTGFIIPANDCFSPLKANCINPDVNLPDFLNWIAEMEEIAISLSPAIPWMNIEFKPFLSIRTLSGNNNNRLLF